ncbi:MAG: hypothetical protein IJ033_01175 [Clostridia bacterium]|nr:hypothetical protein [Clostridia bacterium]
MIAIYILAPLSIILGTLSGYFNIAKKPVSRIFTKGLGSLLFTALALVTIYLKGASLYGILVLGALILGMVGDLYLCMNKDFVLKEKANVLFFIGGSCFFGGHVLFGVVYLISVPFELYLIPCLFVLPMLLAVALIVGKNKIKLGKLTPFAFAYGFILNLMLVVTVNAFIHNIDNVFGVLSLIAGILFVISDGSLLFKEFSHLKGNPVLIYVVLVTYYVAQCLFATSILFY